MSYQIVPLIDLIEEANTEESKNILNEFLKSFSCTRNDDIQDFFLNKSIKYEKHHNAVTYIIINENSEIMAFFSLALKNLIINPQPDELSKNLIKKLKGYGGQNSNEIPGILIGQLARNDKFSKVDITGKEILNFTINKIYEIQRKIGGRFILLDCISEIQPFYEEFDFVKVAKKNNLNRLVKLIIKKNNE